MVPTLHFQGAPQIRHAEVQVLRTTVHRRNLSQPHCRNVHWKKNIVLEKGNVMSSVPRAEAWKLNTATSWHDRGTIRRGGTVKCHPRGRGHPSPPHPWGHHQSPGPWAFHLHRSAFPVHHSWLWRHFLVCFQVQGEESIYHASQEVSPVGLAGVWKVFTWTAMISSDWKRVLPF